MDKLLDDIQRLIQGEEEKPAKGYKLTSEWADEWGKSVSHTSKLIREAVRRGLMVAKPYRRKVGLRLMPVPHYGRK